MAGMKRMVRTAEAAAAHPAVADLLAALVGVRRETCQGGCLLAVHGAEFGHGGQQGRGGVLADTRHGGYDVGLVPQGACAHEGADGLLDVLDLPVQDGQHGSEGSGQVACAGRLGAVLLGHPGRHEVIAAAHQRLELVLAGVGGAPQDEARPALQAVGGHSRASMASLLPSWPRERMKALSLRVSTRCAGRSRRRHSSNRTVSWPPVGSQTAKSAWQLRRNRLMSARRLSMTWTVRPSETAIVSLAMSKPRQRRGRWCRKAMLMLSFPGWLRIVCGRGDQRPQSTLQAMAQDGRNPGWRRAKTTGFRNGSPDRQELRRWPCRRAP